jgi:hypothetical protein
MGELDFFDDWSDCSEEDEAEQQAEAEYQDYIESVHHAANM